MLELLIVIAVAGVLAYLVVPNFNSTVSSAKATEAKWQLNHLYSLQQSYFYLHSKYTADLDELGFEQENLTTQGGNANYEIAIIDAGAEGFKARATAVVDFDQDGAINVWEIDQEKVIKEITKD